MHTFKPDQPITINEGAIPYGNYYFDDYKSWRNENTNFTVKKQTDEYVVVEGDQTQTRFTMNPSDLTPKAEVFKVRVVKCSGAKYWYKDKIGQEFKVKNHDNGTDYTCVELNDFELLRKSDCIVVTDQKFEANDLVMVRGNCARKGVGEHGFEIGYESTVNYFDERLNACEIKNNKGGVSWHVCIEDLQLIKKADQPKPTSLPFTE